MGPTPVSALISFLSDTSRRYHKNMTMTTHDNSCGNSFFSIFFSIL